ncbi:hypothetical protein AB4084_28000, partial [Lysobacter sp. 2RAB21]
ATSPAQDARSDAGRAQARRETRPAASPTQAYRAQVRAAVTEPARGEYGHAGRGNRRHREVRTVVEAVAVAGGLRAPGFLFEGASKARAIGAGISPGRARRKI